MIAFDSLRSALISDQPWQRIDELVRAELATGRTTWQIHQEIKSMREAIHESPGVTEDGMDALGDTLDALVGFCAPDSAYQNLPILPTDGELASVPRWCRVALLARAARRVWPLFAETWHEAREFEIGTVRNDIEVAELAAANGKSPPQTNDLDTVVAALTARSIPVAAAVARAAARAREAAIDAESPYALPIHLDQALIAASEAGKAFGINVDPFIRQDFDQIARLALWKSWIDETPVPPEVFGPLWPDGPPHGWPTDALLPQHSMQ